MIDAMNYFGRHQIPFLFIIDYEMKKPVIIPVTSIDAGMVLFDINGKNNHTCSHFVTEDIPVSLTAFPISYNDYTERFNSAIGALIDGDSYLLNLTCPTRIEINLSLKEIYFRSNAKYKLWFQDTFVVFSPETFITIRDNIISTYPMKGTIDAAVPNAAAVILEDEKEFSEHLTIVDLMRNDLNMVASCVKVEKFRYVEKIQTSGKELYQVSSKINGILDDNYPAMIGTIITSLLPAGSISGAPKKKTVEIIKRTERYERGYYTGIFGYFDGKSLDSGVMIRYIEKNETGVYYKSGGGITVYSDPRREYQEMIDKIYVPIY